MKACAGLLTIALLSSALCAAQQLPDSCLGRRFGGDIEGGSSVRYTDGKPPAHAVVDSRAILGPFVGRPKEIQAIQRGAYSEFVGSYINDGLSGWTGVDIDSMELIWITRRAWDANATYTRKFEIPDPSTLTPEVSVRSWTAPDGRRVEMEIVRRSTLRRDEMLAFICAANLEWSQPAKLEALGTDVAHEFLQLVNFGPLDGGFPATKQIPRYGVTAFAMNAIVARRQLYWKF